MNPDLHALTCAIYNTHHSISQVKQLHLAFLKRGILNSALTIGNRLLQLYSRCGSMVDARQLFMEMPQRNCFSWSTMIEGYMKLGHKYKSLELFDIMPQKSNYSWNVVVSGFAKAGELEIAHPLFNAMPRKNELVWNSMIHGYVRNGQPGKALMLFKNLNSDPSEARHRDTFILATVIRACTDLLALSCGKQIHARIFIDDIELDSVLCSSLINLYGKCGDFVTADHIMDVVGETDDFSLSAMISGYAHSGRMNEARRIFERKVNPCHVLWNSIISGYISNCEELEALALFNRMRISGVEEDPSTIANILSACSSLLIIELVIQMHAHATKAGVSEDIIVASALLDAYAKCQSLYEACKLFSELKAHDTVLLNTMITVYSTCGRIDDAKGIFKTMSNKTMITWNSMVVGLSQNACPHEALDIFCQMVKLDLKLDKFSIASVISSCASTSSLKLGEQIFGKAITIGLESDQIISTSLVDFYCKCGFAEIGHKIFDGMIKTDEVSWNTMLTGYATNGYGFEALALFSEMRLAGVRPSGITFIAVLSACDQSGLLEEGRNWFSSMKCDYNIDPGIEHYSCMVDLLARAGSFREAMDLMEEMPFEADASMWSSILRGCVAHGNKTLGKKAAEQIIELDPGNSSAFIQLSNILATSDDWEGSAQVRNLMRDKHVQKSPGYSWADC
ncbi:putative pentatricopeptide repeat-containing protein At1g77010, mitochondrial [Neltuma alba]|uniref:putative pentatricopeptide repeat-containing protein At1g77010, mitochondrial n=1 Tax=Neltuma alba TaxID=207710 RepID=UPI0010A482D6|nr:putative pentatricopeptide repeat-containing protein At1g77010, mitochondrial [Prosopis alba]XP_028752754.1 putative pentatricopeptide repeat-containing protein At1g77010, mitochondrial [Prosopis alba]